MGYNAAMRQKMISEFEQASSLGHSCLNLIPVRQTKTQMGWAILCTCGWSSNSRKRKLAAASLGYMHVLDVIHGVVPPFTPMTGEMPPEDSGVSIAEVLADAS